MWGIGDFVRQKPAPKWAKWVILIVIALGLIAGGIRILDSFDLGQSYLGALEIAWIVGAATASFIALQERMKL